MRTDTERLDWLEAQEAIGSRLSSEWAVDWPYPRNGEPGEFSTAYGPDLRSAIDSAMDAEEAAK